MPHKTENRFGFTILELLVSIVIFVVILMAMAGFSTLMIKTNGANEVRNAAVRVGLSKLHQVTLLSFDSSPADSSGFLQVRDGTVAYTVTFSSSSPASLNIKKIEETMKYKYRGEDISFTLSTIVLKQ